MQLTRTVHLQSPAAWARFLLTTLIGLAVDLWTKSWAHHALAIPGPWPPHSRTIVFIRGWIDFQYVENPGAVFGIGPGQRGLFILISILAIAFLTYLFIASGRQRFYQFILGLLLAGVLGNLYDRILLGRVRDMIYALPRWPKAFPWIFNAADAMLCTGVALMILHMLFADHRADAA